ncbi:co-chaperone GroES [Candidatus Parcubacteria bacterium]|nr:co-chaperone GroES [Candidatus Parcubacteria bacterium]
MIKPLTDHVVGRGGLTDHVVVEPLKEEKKKGGIILPETINKERPEKGKVVAVGPGKVDKDGKRVPIEVKKGDVVLFTKYGPQEVKINDKEYLIVRQDDILAIID